MLAKIKKFFFLFYILVKTSGKEDILENLSSNQDEGENSLFVIFCFRFIGYSRTIILVLVLLQTLIL